MKNIIGTFVAMQGFSCLACGLTTESFVAFCASGIAGAENIITSKNSGINENRLLQDRKMK